MPSTTDILRIRTSMPTAPYQTASLTPTVLDFVYVPAFVPANASKAVYGVADNGYVPQIAPRRTSELGGRGLYEDVIETIGVHVFGHSADNALQNLAMLARVLDQADAYGQRQNVPPVLFDYQPAGSVFGGPLTVPILGRAAGDQTANLAMQPTWIPDLQSYVIRNVTVRFRRPGTWLLDSFLSENLVPFNSSGETADFQSPGLSYFTSWVTSPRGWAAVTGASGPTVTPRSLTRTTADSPSLTAPWPVLEQTGSSSVQVTTSGTTAGDGIMYQAIPLTNGLNVPYTLSFWLKAPVGNSLTVKPTPTEDSTVTAYQFTVTATGAWQRVTATFTPTATYWTHAGATSLDLKVIQTNATPAITIQVDALKVTLQRNDGRDTDYNPSTLESTRGYPQTWTAAALLNAGFETWSGGLPSSWTKDVATTVAQDTTNVSAGASSALLTPSSGFAEIWQDVGSLIPGLIVRFSFWALGSTSGMQASAHILDTTGFGLLLAGSTIVTGVRAAGWQQVMVYVTVPDQGTPTSTLRFVVHLDGSTAANVDAALVEQEGAPTPSVLAVRFPTQVGVASPLRVELDYLASGASLPAGTLVVTNHPSRIQLIACEAGTIFTLVGATATTTADATTHARGGSFVRFNQSTLHGETTVIVPTPTASGSDPGMVTRNLLLFAAVRGQGTGNWTLTPLVRGSTTAGNYVRGRPYVFDATQTGPRLVNLGVTAYPRDIKQWGLGITTDAASAANLDIDYLVAVAADDESTQVITLAQATLAATNGALLAVTHNPLLTVAPEVRLYDTGGDYTVSGLGDLALLTTGDYVACAFLAMGTNGTDWTYYLSFLGQALPLAMRATRVPAYLVPR